MDTNQIKRVLNTLDEDEETIKILYYFIQRLTESQIATRVGLSEGTVRSRLHNISAKMSAGYVLNDEAPGDPLDPKYRFITGEVEIVVLHALGRDAPDWSKFPFDISMSRPRPRPPIETRPTPNEANRLNIAIWGVVAVFFLFGGWRFIQLVAWDCNPFTSNLFCGVVNGDDGEEVAEVNPTPSPPPTIAIDIAAEETRIQSLVNEGLTSQAPTPVTPDPTGTEQAIQTEAARRVEQILTETAAAKPTEIPSNTPSPTITLTPSITPTPSDTPTITPIPPLLFANFENGNYAGWSVQGGDWTIDVDEQDQHGLMCLRRGTIIYEGADWDNYTISADIQFLTDTGVIGVLGRRSTPWDFYRADLMAEDTARLAQNYQVTTQRDDFRVIQPVSFLVETGQTYNIELRMFGVQITMLVDDQEMVNVIHNGHSMGGVGLFCGDSTIAIFDNILVENLGN